MDVFSRRCPFHPGAFSRALASRVVSVSALVAGFCLAVPRPAAAGQWQVVLRGSRTGETNGANGPALFNSPETTYTGAANQTLMSSWASNGTFHKAQLNSLFSIICTWVPDPGKTLQNDPPPLQVSVRSRMAATGSVRYQNPSGIVEASNAAGTLAITNRGSMTLSSQSRGTVLFSSSNPQRNSVVTFGPFAQHAKASQTASSFGSSSDSMASHEMQAWLDNRRMWISSPTIEDSYSKATQGPLPPGINFGDRLKHDREADMSLATDSVVENSPIYREWIGSSRLTSTVQGFQSPQYDWKYSGNGHLVLPPLADPPERLPYLSDVFTNNGWTNDQSQKNLTVGFGTNAADILGKQSVVTLDVTDSDGAKATNTFKINWHLPYEWQNAPYDTIDMLPIIFPDQGSLVLPNETVRTKVEPNVDLGFQIQEPVTQVKVITKDGLATTATVLNVAAAGVGVIIAIQVAAGTAAAVSGAWVVLALAGISGVTQYASGAMPAPTPQTRQTDYAQYKAAIRLQKEVNDARLANPNAFPGHLSRCDDPDVVNAAVTEMDRLEGLYPGNTDGYWTEDSYFSQGNGELRCEAWAGRYSDKQFWKGDEYNAHGYVGECKREITRQKNIFYVFKWSFTPNQVPDQNPGGGGSGG